MQQLANKKASSRDRPKQGLCCKASSKGARGRFGTPRQTSPKDSFGAKGLAISHCRQSAVTPPSNRHLQPPSFEASSLQHSKASLLLHTYHSACAEQVVARVDNILGALLAPSMQPCNPVTRLLRYKLHHVMLGHRHHVSWLGHLS